MRLLFRRAESHLVQLYQRLRHVLLAALQHSNQIERMLLLLMVAFDVEEGDGLAFGTGTAGSAASMNVVLYCQREGVVQD